MNNAFVTIVGRLIKDPELKQVNSNSVCELAVSVTTDKKGADGYYETNIYNCSVWGKIGETVAQNAKKGSTMFVTGTMSIRAYVGRSGEASATANVRASDVRILDSASSAKQSNTAPAKKVPVKTVNDDEEDFL